MKFVTFKLARKLKDKGFKEECLCHYIGDGLVYNIESHIANNQLWFSHNKFDNIWHRDNYDAPTISQVLEWLRKEKNLHIAINTWGGTWGYDIIGLTCGSGLHWTAYREDIKSYDDAALDGIEYALNNLI